MAMDPITGAEDLIKSAITRIWPDASQKEQALAAFETLKETDSFKRDMSQLQINLADAQSKSKFQAWWRPALAWSCVAAFVYHFLVYHFAILAVPHLQDVDSADFNVMMGTLTVLIGARTYDKAKGTDTK